MNPVYKLWGREPALWLALISSAVILVSTFFFELTTDQQGTINAASVALFGLLTAWFVARDGLQAAVLGFLQAGISLMISFGLNWSPDQQMIVMGFLTTVVAMFVRSTATAPVNEAGKHMADRSVVEEIGV